MDKDIKDRFDIYHVTLNVEFLPGQTMQTHLSLGFADYALAEHSLEYVKEFAPTAGISGGSAVGDARNDHYFNELAKTEKRDEWYRIILGISD